MSAYTNCDIEVHMTDMVAGMDTAGLDEDASNARARKIVADAIMDAYPEHTVHVHMDDHTVGPFLTVQRCPEDVDEESLNTLASDALADYDKWLVEIPAHD